MKTSNYIIIAFFVFLFGGLLVLFADSKNKSLVGETLVSRNFSEKAIANLEDFSVLVVEPGASINLKERKEDHSKLAVFSQGDSTSITANYELKNDTLFYASQNGSIQLYSSKLKSIIIEEGAKAFVNNFPIDTMAIRVSSGQLVGFFKGSGGSKAMMDVQAKNGKIQLSDLKVEKLNLELYHTRADIHNATISEVTGKVMDGSGLYGSRTIHKMMLEFDETSSYNLQK